MTRDVEDYIRSAYIIIIVSSPSRSPRAHCIYMRVEGSVG